MEDDGTRQPVDPSYHISDAMIDYLYVSGLIERMNDRFGLLVDTYEEELVTPEIVPELLSMLDDELAKVQGAGTATIPLRPDMGTETEISRREVEQALNGMKALMAEAARKGRGTWFIF